MPVTIEGDPGKALRLVLLGVAMTGCSVFVLATGGPVVVGIAGLALFGSATLLLLAQVVRPPTLSVTTEGIALRSLRSWRMSWHEVADIRLTLAGRRSSFVVVDYREDARPAMLFGRRRRGQVVPSTLRLPPEELRVLLFDALRAARAGSAEPQGPIPTPAPDLVEPPRWAVPWVSVALAVVLSLVFAAEIRFPVSPVAGDLEPSNLTLTAFGASSRDLTLHQGEWFRAFLAPLLHANLGHLIGNVLALLWAGWLLEKVVGRPWFLAIYAVGGLAGEAVSLVWNPGDTIDVGASGAIMALSAATYAMSFHFRGSHLQQRLRSGAVQILAPALFNAWKTSGGGLHINVAAHAGGAAAGAGLGLLLLRGWPRQARHPGKRSTAGVLAGLGCAAVLAAVVPAVSDYRALSDIAAAQLAFQAGDVGEASGDIERILKRHPADAEAWIAKGTIALALSDPRGAMTDFGTAYRLQPTPGILGLRGLAAFYAGEPAAALSDLQEAASHGAWLYPAIWLDMIRERQGLDPSLVPGDLAGASHDWPWPVAEMFAGAITPEQLIAEAARSRKAPSSDEVCEADVYVAEWSLAARHRRDDARERFSKAAGECPSNFYEASMARLELARTEAP